MKLSGLSYLACLLSLTSFIAETVAAPVSLYGASDNLESQITLTTETLVGSPVDVAFNSFLVYLKSPEGTVFTNICFFSGKTNGVNVAAHLTELSQMTGCEYAESLLARAQIPKETFRNFTHQQWNTISAQLATNTKGHQQALLGTLRKDAVFCEAELPILRGYISSERITMDLWEVDGKGALAGPKSFNPAEWCRA